MFNKIFKRFVVAVVMSLGLSVSAIAATFQIEMASQTTTFDAPLGGGGITGFSIAIGGVTFDTPEAGALSPVYDAVENDIQGIGGLFGYFSNSLAGPGCAAGLCLLEFEDSNMGMPPKLWAVFPLVMGFPGGVIASGEYVITVPDAQIPLPAPAFLLIGGIAALAATRARRKPV